ncbi:FAD synthetase family protein [Alteribacillus bidgolensis]|uniref:FAD synthase n=1 Tax=Alteribacillus bidgolensis TaxID=930129 RepID=A0A1G8QVB8_9BACI|nr:FAD synthetase family protein [Alteribacillus bidgolensis]SDJ08646.1 riboflavin kinase / FMN adenylyltransferase [Alteribacillus bidgolensis]
MKTIQLGYPITDALKNKSEPCVMALGFFDGVHLGHQQIIKTAKTIAAEKNLKLAVMTFFPHPSAVIKKGNQVTKYITPLSVKKEIFEKMGVDLLYVVDFNMDVAKIPHDQFVNEYLDGLQCKHAVGGFDYTYGFKGKGNMAQLNIDANGRFGVTTVEKLEKKHHKVSSTLLRELISSGRVEDIPTYLGSRYALQGILQRRANNYILYIDSDYFLPCPGSYEVTLKNGVLVTKGLCEIKSSDQPGELHIRMFYGQPFENTLPVQLQWENFIADYEMDAFHAQARFDEMEVSM